MSPPDPPVASGERHDVLVIGGGPSGAATAYWLAEAGHDVVFVERKTFPREKTCGDGLTPRAVHQLQEMGLGERLDDFHRYDGLRACAHGIELELHWPQHPVYPSYGYVVRRCDLDTMVAEHAVKSGAVLRQGTEAVAPLLVDGLVAGAVVKDKESGRTEEIRARYVVIADGANSRFGRALGTTRDRSYPQGMAIRGYFASDISDTPWIESALDVRDRNGNSLPGYGWIFPLGDGQINVGIGLLSTFRDFKSVNTTHIMNEFAADRPRALGHLARGGHVGADRRAPAHGRIGRAQGGTDLDRGGRRGRLDQPVQRRGHRLRLRDRAGWPPSCSTRRSRPATAWCCSATPACWPTSTACTSRWPGCSPRSSASRR